MCSWPDSLHKLLRLDYRVDPTSPPVSKLSDGGPKEQVDGHIGNSSQTKRGESGGVEVTRHEKSGLGCSSPDWLGSQLVLLLPRASACHLIKTRCCFSGDPPFTTSNLPQRHSVPHCGSTNVLSMASALHQTMGGHPATIPVSWRRRAHVTSGPSDKHVGHHPCASFATNAPHGTL